MTADAVAEHELEPEQDDRFDDRDLTALYRETIDRRDDYDEGTEPYQALTELADRLETTIDRFAFTEAHYDDVAALFEYSIENALYDDGDRVTDP